MERLVETCAIIYVINDNRVLLIKHIKSGQFMGVGGHKETYENLVECAIRETFEESRVALTVENFDTLDMFGKPSPLCSYTFEMENHEHEVFVFIANTENTEIELESSDGGWYTYNEAIKLDLADNVRQILDYIK